MMVESMSAIVRRFFSSRRGPVACGVAVGAILFLGCPWRAWLRLAGGDGNALFGVIFLGMGFSLGRNRPAGWIMPLLARPAALLFSEEGPESQHAPWAVSVETAGLYPLPGC
jgi:hypothetical protein